MTVFADHLHCPTGFEFYNGGVIVAQAPDLMFFKDTDGNGKADFKKESSAASLRPIRTIPPDRFVLDPGGALYFQEGVFHTTQAETAYGPPVRNKTPPSIALNRAPINLKPISPTISPIPMATFSIAGVRISFMTAPGRSLITERSFPEKPTFLNGTGTRHSFISNAPARVREWNILSSRQFPESMQGNLLVGNVIGFLGILQYKVSDTNSGFFGTKTEPLVQSDDPNFRPSDVKVGPDGAVYFLEWQNPIIGHMQHHLRDPSRDHVHGRIYRITYAAQPTLKPVNMAELSIPKLLDLLREPEDRVRSRAKIELSGRNTKDVMAALDKWVPKLDAKSPDHEHDLMEALWIHQYHNVVDEPLLKQMLRSPDFHARAAATRVLCYWRDRVQDPLGLLKAQVNDEHPRVRLEAVRACSFFTTPQAADVALETLNHPMDKFLQYAMDETMTTLERFTKQAKE